MMNRDESTERAWALLERMAECYGAILGDNLRGVYAHGSLAFRCFRWESSDIDFLVVTADEPSQREKERMIEALLRFDQEAPPKGFEMSVVLEEDCRAPAYPPPYALHFSNAHKARCRKDLAGYCREMRGVDPDLTAHFAVTRAVGVVVRGKKISEVFGEISPEDYWKSIRYDLDGMEEGAAADPVYVILNLARALAFKRERMILSKEQGAAWGMEHLEQGQAVIAAARRAYASSEPFRMDAKSVKDFMERMKALIEA